MLDDLSTEDLIALALDQGEACYREELPNVDEESGEVTDEIALREYLLDVLEDEE